MTTKVSDEIRLQWLADVGCRLLLKLAEPSDPRDALAVLSAVRRFTDHMLDTIPRPPLERPPMTDLDGVEGELKRLADYLIAVYPTEIGLGSADENPVDVAIRLLDGGALSGPEGKWGRDMIAEMGELRAELERARAGS